MPNDRKAEFWEFVLYGDVNRIFITAKVLENQPSAESAMSNDCKADFENLYQEETWITAIFITAEVDLYWMTAGLTVEILKSQPSD